MKAGWRARQGKYFADVARWVATLNRLRAVNEDEFDEVTQQRVGRVVSRARANLDKRGLGVDGKAKAPS